LRLSEHGDPFVVGFPPLHHDGLDHLVKYIPDGSVADAAALILPAAIESSFLGALTGMLSGA
jgi:hypothetical protein